VIASIRLMVRILFEEKLCYGIVGLRILAERNHGSFDTRWLLTDNTFYGCVYTFRYKLSRIENLYY